ncbi:cilia- and flagella-associated protein 300 isoform X2 [Ooceraea biroi]|uniref:cilia- and flagella-associated protein 300 isoform X2 n=1 Tax=Ooceraea biroi TaxID=2015173 RepID=UPI000F09A0E8|nr:cilia- and flagella-associated protein 300 isoform X2 [Ooceraea biroi]
MRFHSDNKCIEMEIEPHFTFMPSNEKTYVGFDDKEMQEYLSKWGLRGNFFIQNFLFNGTFQEYHKYHMADTFFKDDLVAKTLLSKQDNVWIRQGTICKRYDMQREEFLISDNLRNMLLNEEAEEYNLYSEEERNEFLFRIFQILVLGGTLCQFEDTLQPYLNVTKSIYKDLIRVQQQSNTNNLVVDTLVLEVIAKDHRGQEYFPSNSSHRQNVAFLLIHTKTREITTFVHQYGGYCNSVV